MWRASLTSYAKKAKLNVWGRARYVAWRWPRHLSLRYQLKYHGWWRGDGYRSWTLVLWLRIGYHQSLHHTRGAGPFPTELFDDIGEHIGTVGQEFGATTGRARRCGWFDAAILRRAVVLNSLSGICLTKLDVLDDLEQLNICTGYELPSGEVCGSSDAEFTRMSNPSTKLCQVGN